MKHTTMKAIVKINATIQKETEKAIYVELTWNHVETSRNHNFNTWIPKSQCDVNENGVFLAKWLADKIGDELRANYGMCKNLGGKGIVYDLA